MGAGGEGPGGCLQGIGGGGAKYFFFGAEIPKKNKHFSALTHAHFTMAVMFYYGRSDFTRRGIVSMAGSFGMSGLSSILCLITSVSNEKTASAC